MLSSRQDPEAPDHVGDVERPTTLDSVQLKDKGPSMKLRLHRDLLPDLAGSLQQLALDQ